MIFVGPSLRFPRDGVRTVPALLDTAPPALRGDLLAAANRGYESIGLVDGELLQRSTVTPGEVREVARRGVRLWGAASVGALRAVECAEWMTGIGEIFAAYRDGVLTGDDEVAMTYEPDTYAPVAHPLVNVRAALRLGVVRGWWSDEAARATIADVKGLAFYDRTLHAVLETARRHALPAEQVRRALEDGAADVKAGDAIALCRMMTAPGS